jgi:hypothetical protein
MFASMDTFVLLLATNEAMLPCPLAASPIDGCELVQLNCVGDKLEVNSSGFVLEPLHAANDEGVLNKGRGFTVIELTDVAFPKQLLASAETVIVEVIGPVNEFVAVKAGTFPCPVSGRPISALELNHAENVVPDTGPVNTIGVETSPAQRVCDGTGLTVGNGFTVTCRLKLLGAQVLLLTVTR